MAEGFAWDSSILPGVGLGNHAGRAFRHGDWFMIDDALAEFPVASWRALGIPFTHSYRQLMGRLAESLLERVASLPTLLGLRHAHGGLGPRRPDREIASAAVAEGAPMRWRGVGSVDSATWRRWGERLRARGYEWSTLSHCHGRLTGRG